MRACVHATYPLGFSEQTVVRRTDQPDRGPLGSRRAGRRRGEERPDQGLRVARDTQPDVFADLRTNVHNFWGDRGLLGLALDPDFPNATVLYTYEAAMGWHGTARVHRGCYVGPSPQPTGRDHRRLRRRRTPITNDRLWERGGRQ
jgi:hypothetical protein